jgi:two-component system sensor histidine kinase KdpD
MSKSIIPRRIELLRIVRAAALYHAGFVAIAIVTSVGFLLQFNLMTISFLYLLIVIWVAFNYGFWQASFMSLLSVVCLDYFFLPPLFHFEIADPKDWMALAEFELTALIVSRLSARELHHARELTIHREAMEKLYELSRHSLLMDMSQAPGSQLAILIRRVFEVSVALYDANLGREDRAGEWKDYEEGIAKECFLNGAAQDDPETHTSRRLLQAGLGPVGALSIRGSLASSVVDALASLAAIAIDRHQSFEKEERAENASKREQLRASVMDALAHELKTPLAAVQTASSGLLELGGLTEPQRDLIALIDAEAVRLNELCTRLLRTAKLEAKRVGMDTDDVNVLELVSEVLANRPTPAEMGRIQVAVEDPTLTVRVDRGLLATILAQYIDNAWKYSKPDTPIAVAARKSHTEVLFSVHNFGSTIRIEDRERIFDRFYRSPDRKDDVPGTGIGLSVARKAAEAHHGHVWVISDDQEGTTFFLSLPIGARRMQ